LVATLMRRLNLPLSSHPVANRAGEAAPQGTPFSQRMEFSGHCPAEQFGTRYQQRGHELGGRGHTTSDGIDRLRLDAERATLILLCMEEAPGDSRSCPLDVRYTANAGYRSVFPKDTPNNN
jgi:hypothetical protein